MKLNLLFEIFWGGGWEKTKFFLCSNISVSHI